MLNGLGLRKAFVFVKVYVGGLYLQNKSKDANAIVNSDIPRSVLMKFVHDVDKPKMAEAWETGMKNNLPAAAFPVVEARLKKMIGMISDVKEGDTMQMTYLPGKGTEIFQNGKLLGNIDGADFATALFAIYLGPKPPSENIREGMLGGKCG